MIKSFNPADPSDLIAEFEEPTPEEVSATLDRAAEAQLAWAADAAGRSAALSRLEHELSSNAAEFEQLITREVGKPVTEARGEVQRAISLVRFYAQVALDPLGELFPGSAPGTRISVTREPLGVIFAVCPWNFPLAIPLWKLAPALAYGNTAVLKPASEGVGVATLLAECMERSLPDGVCTVVKISGRSTAAVLDDDRIKAVTFTGSTEVGLGVAAQMAARGAPAQAEMGGQNPAIVLADADIDAAADDILYASMGYAGQKCTATRRVIVTAEISDRFSEALAGRIERVAVGEPSREDVVVGPLISGRALDEFNENVDRALTAGAEVLAKAEGPQAGDGFFPVPTLLREDRPDAAVNQEETFGPLVTLIEVPDEAAAVEAANATPFGLSSSVHSRDVARAATVSGQIRSGLQRVNLPTSGVDFYAPFGGEGRSSFGPREQGRASREFFTSTRTMTIADPGQE